MVFKVFCQGPDFLQSILYISSGYLFLPYTKRAGEGEYNVWDNVFKNRSSKICGRQPLKNLRWGLFFKGCHPQILLGPFLNTFSHMSQLWVCRNHWTFFLIFKMQVHVITAQPIQGVLLQFMYTSPFLAHSKV